MVGFGALLALSVGFSALELRNDSEVVVLLESHFVEAVNSLASGLNSSVVRDVRVLHPFSSFPPSKGEQSLKNASDCFRLLPCFWIPDH